MKRSVGICVSRYYILWNTVYYYLQCALEIAWTSKVQIFTLSPCEVKDVKCKQNVRQNVRGKTTYWIQLAFASVALDIPWRGIPVQREWIFSPSGYYPIPGVYEVYNALMGKISSARKIVRSTVDNEHIHARNAETWFSFGPGFA